MMENNLTYENALQEIQTILKSLESGEITLDETASKVKRAGELLEFCQKKLRALEDDMEEIFNKED